MVVFPVPASACTAMSLPSRKAPRIACCCGVGGNSFTAGAADSRSSLATTSLMAATASSGPTLRPVYSQICRLLRQVKLARSASRSSAGSSKLVPDTVGGPDSKLMRMRAE